MGLFSTKTLEEFIDIMTKSDEKKDFVEAICTAHAVDMISRTISSTELQVYRYDSKTKKSSKKKEEVYYRLNIKPNPNENGSNFKKKLVRKLLLEGKALAVFQKKYGQKVDYQYLAEIYETDSKILDEKTFKNVTLMDDEGNTFTFIRDFKLKNGECVYFIFSNEDIKLAIETYKSKMSKLIGVAEKAFKVGNINKWRLKGPSNQPKMIDAETGKEIDYSKYKEKITEGLLSDEEAIILLSEIFDLVLINEKSGKDSSDLLKLTEECGNKIAMIFNIPLDLFFGKKTEKSQSNNDFITFACNPIMKSIEDGYNGALIAEQDFIKGECIVFNRFMMQYIDITTLGKSLDKLTAIGFSFNQLCDMIGVPGVDEAWANEHHITKNYADVKGGGEDE